MSSVEEAQEFFSRKYTFMGDELAKHIMTILNELDNKNKDIERLIKENEELKKVLDERFIHVVGARTVYGRLMQLGKEIIVKDDLKLRNEIEKYIKENEEWQRVYQEEKEK